MQEVEKGAPGRGWCAIGLAVLALAGPAAAQSAPAPAPAADNRRLDVSEYIVRGNTVLDARTIETALLPFSGPARTQADLESARDALLAAYQAKGYQSVYVDLPEQSGDGGLVFLLVTETRVGRVRVVGAEHTAPLQVRDQVTALKEGEVPDFNRAQSELTALNRGGQRQVVPLVKTGALPGTMDVDLKVEDKSPLTASAGLNNDHSADTKPLRLLLSVGHNNLWQRGHSVSLSFFGTPEDFGESNVWSGAYVAPMAGTPWSLEVSGYVSDSDVATTGGTTVLGKGDAIGIKATYTVPDSGDWYQTLSLGVDFKRNKEQLRMGTSGDVVPLNYAPITAAYSGFVQDGNTQASFGLSLVAGTRSFFGFGSSEAEFDYKRYKATPSFVVFKGDTQITVDLPSLGNTQLGLRAAGQLTDSPLVSSEQISAGGMNSVRGYLSAESTGDYGLVGSVEWRTPALTVSPWLDAARAYVFTDVGQVRLRDPLPEQQSSFPLWSVGIGGSFKLAEHVSGRVDLASPLKAGARTELHDPRVTFSVNANY